MIRQSGKRISFALRRLKWDFEHTMALFHELKAKHEALLRGEAEAALASTSGATADDVSVIGSDEGTDAATLVDSDSASDDFASDDAESSSDDDDDGGIETPTRAESPAGIISEAGSVSCISLAQVPSFARLFQLVF